MRLLQRDTQPVYISRYLGLTQGVDSKGRLTGHDVVNREDPEPFYPSVTIDKGEAAITNFGENVQYDRIITIDDPTFRASEADVFWIDAPLTGKYDYVATRVGHKGSLTVIAVRKIEVS